MYEFKKLLVASMGLTLGLAACDVEENCNEAGVCETSDGGAGGAGGGAGGAGGGAGGAGGGGDTFDWVLIVDDSAEENMAGTPGADICGIDSSCGSAIAAFLNPGGGDLCDAEGPNCAANRADPDAARDSGEACDADSAPSHYVSLGMSGTLSVQFSESQAGCTLTVVEHQGSQQEGYEVYVCAGQDSSSGCLNGDAAIETAGNGGTVQVNVPNE